MAERPNIVVILTDQQHSGMMSCAGNKWVETPNMDRLAARGTRYERCYCTSPVCSPSRFSLMTGYPPSHIGQVDNALPPVPEALNTAVKQSGLGHQMRALGYRAAFAGKQHFPGMTAADLGFEYLCQDERDVCAETCADFLLDDQDAPFLLVVSLINPHDICYMAIRAYNGQESDNRLVRNAKIELEELDAALAWPDGVDEETFFAKHCPPLPANFEIPPEEPEAVQKLADLRPFRAAARANWTERDWRLHRWAYARLTERVDGQVGVVLDALTASGHAANTLVLFSSDHGDMDATRRMEHKTLLYDEASRVPLLAVWPGVVGAGDVDYEHLINNGLDLLPTCVELAGGTVPADRHGRSLAPVLRREQPADWREYTVAESEVGRMLRSRTHKYNCYATGTRREELFDMRTDPLERVNLATLPEHQTTLNAHRAMLADWIATVGDAIGNAYAIAGE